MSASNKTAAGGNKYAYLGFVDEFGFLIGGTPTAPSSGATGNPMNRLDAIKSAAPAVPEREAIQITGDDDLYGEIPLTSLATRRFNATMAVDDLQRDANLQNTNVETLGEIAMGVLDILDDVDYDTCLILQSRALKGDAGVRGKKAWNGRLVPLATTKPLGRRTFEERAAADFALDITPQLASYNPWGITMLEANAGTTGARYRPFSSEYPIVMERHTGNGVLSTFTLTNKPVSVAKMYVVVNRVLATVTAVSTTTPYSFTVSAAPADGAKIITMMEFQP